MTDPAEHAIQSVELEEGRPTTPVAFDVVRSGLSSEENVVRSHASRVAAGLARADPDRSSALAPALADAVASDHGVVVHWSMAALRAIAEVHPHRVESTADRLVELLTHELPEIRTLAARTLVSVALERSEMLGPCVDDLVAAAGTELDELIRPEEIAATEYDDQARTLHLINADHVTDQVYARQVAANLLVEVAAADPTAVKPYVPRLVDRLSDDDVAVVTALADVLGTIAEDDPGAVADAVGPLRGLLGHPDEGLVATTIATLGRIGDPTAVGSLRSLADDADRSEDLRAFASETADVLERARSAQ